MREELTVLSSYYIQKCTGACNRNTNNRTRKRRFQNWLASNGPDVDRTDIWVLRFKLEKSTRISLTASLNMQALMNSQEVLRIETLLVYCPIYGLHVKSSLCNPVIIHHFAHVIPRGVSKKDSYTFVLPNVVLLDKPQSACHSGSAAAANQQPFMSNNGTNHCERFIVVGFHPIVHNVSVKNGGNEVVTNTFDLIRCKTFLAGARGSIAH